MIGLKRIRYNLTNMRWKKKLSKPKKEPCVGETRIQHRFAFFPVLIRNEWVWLERYNEIEVWAKNDPQRIHSRCSWHFSYKETINY